MERAGALVALNRRILEEYSRRTSEALSAALPFRVALPHLERVLASNVGKEVAKDALVIRRARDAVALGSPPSREHFHELLDATKDIDRDFLAGVGSLPIGIVISYDEIAPLRLQRIERLCHASFRILQAWEPGRGRALWGRAKRASRRSSALRRAAVTQPAARQTCIREAERSRPAREVTKERERWAAQSQTETPLGRWSSARGPSPAPKQIAQAGSVPSDGPV